MNATLKNVREARPVDLAEYDLVGVGSGIYGGISRYMSVMGIYRRL